MKFKGIFIVAIILIILGSCVTTPDNHFILESDNLQDDAVVLMVSSSLTITEINGHDVLDEWYPKNMRRDIKITLPAGETNFIYNMYWLVTAGQQTRWLEGKDIKFNFNFEPSREYTIGYYKKSVGNFFIPKYELYLAVWDGIYQNPTHDTKHDDRIIKQWLVTIY